MLLKLLLIAIAICVFFSLFTIFFRKKELNEILYYVKTIRENVVVLGDTTFFVARTMDARFSKKGNYHNYISVHVFDDRTSFDSSIVKQLNLATRKRGNASCYIHEFILNKRMNFIEIFVLLMMCYLELTKLYPNDTIRIDFLDKFPTIQVRVCDEEASRQKEVVCTAKTELALKEYKLKFCALQNDNFLPPWIVDEAVEVIKKIGCGQDEAQKAIVDLLLQLGLDIDIEYKKYKIPRTLSRADFDLALMNCQTDAAKNGVSVDDIVAFRMRCIPNETANNAKVAVIASKILTERGEK